MPMTSTGPEAVSDLDGAGEEAGQQASETLRQGALVPTPGLCPGPKLFISLVTPAPLTLR